MKKLIINLLLCLFSIGIVFTLCACGDDSGEKTKKPVNEFYELDCEHRWTLASKKEATCTEDSSITILCKKCRERKTIIFDDAGCDYTASWEWHNDNTTVTATIKCEKCNSPSYTVNGVIMNGRDGDVVLWPTCQREGKRVFRAEAYYGKNTFYTEKEESIPTTFCSPKEQEVIYHGSFCYDKIETVTKCGWCQRVLQQKTDSYSHTELTTKDRFELSELGYCGGYVEYRECACGVVSTLDVYNSCNQEDIEIVKTERTVGNETHIKTTATCKSCGFSVEEEIGVFSVPLLYSYNLYKNVTVHITDDIILTKRDGYSLHENDAIGHEIETEYELWNGNCENGYYIVEKCTECPYYQKRYTKSHSFTEEEISLKDYGACGGTLVIRKCHCGYYSQAHFERTDDGECKLEQITPNEVFGFEVTTPNYARAWRCTECGISYYIGNVYQVENIVDNLYFGVWHNVCLVRMGDEIIAYENSFLDYLWFDAAIDAELSQEEKESALAYINKRLTENITGEERQMLLYVKQLLEEELKG